MYLYFFPLLSPHIGPSSSLAHVVPPLSVLSRVRFCWVGDYSDSVSSSRLGADGAGGGGLHAFTAYVPAPKTRPARARYFASRRGQIIMVY